MSVVAASWTSAPPSPPGPRTARSATGLEEPTEDYVETSRSALLNDFTGVVNGRFKLVRYTHLPDEELYDLQRDPYELDNLLRDGDASYAAMTPQARATVDALRGEVDRLTTCSGVTDRWRPSRW